jgi:hypothetical protein
VQANDLVCTQKYSKETTLLCGLTPQLRKIVKTGVAERSAVEKEYLCS